jgi:hypothetical protein
MDIAEWLHGIGLQQYGQTFRDNAIEVSLLPDLTDQHFSCATRRPESNRRSAPMTSASMAIPASYRRDPKSSPRPLGSGVGDGSSEPSPG